MAAALPKIRTARLLLMMGCAATCISGHAQTASQTSPALPSPPPAAASTPAPPSASPAKTSNRSREVDPLAGRPLPDINSLMVQVEAQEKASRKTIKQYIYRSINTEQDLDSHGAVKKTTTVEREFFCVNVACFNKLISRDGKPLSGDELKKQNERIDQRIAEAKARNEKIAAGQPPAKKQDSDEITFARF